jgi:hypothetical protein
MNMASTIIEQFRYECDGWMRLLSFFQEENMYLQKRLFEMVRGTINNTVLQQAENLQTNILEHDDIIKELNHAIAQQDRQLMEYGQNKPLNLAELMKCQNELRKQIWKEEWFFNGLQANFSGYVEGMSLGVKD